MAANGFMSVDLTGASGVYLTLSRNETDFTTFNLADPSCDAVAFQNFIALGQNGASCAFFKYPDILPDELILPSDQSGVAGMTVAGNIITPRHGVAGYEFVADSLAFGSLIVNKPFEITPEYNTLTAKATPDVPAEQDIFYSLDGAVDGGTVTIVSHAVIQFASAAPSTITGLNGVDICNVDNVGYYITDFPDSGPVREQRYPTFEAVGNAYKAAYDFQADFLGLLDTEETSIYWTGEPASIGKYYLGNRGDGVLIYEGACR